MAEEKGTATPTTAVSSTATNKGTESTSDFSDTHALDNLFSSEGEPIGIVPVDEAGGGGTTTETETTDEPTEETTETVETTEDESTEEVETPTEEETEFAVEDSDRDYSQGAYERAAAHFGKRYGRQFDLTNNSDKALLRDLMEQQEQKSKQATETETTETEEQKEAREAEERSKKEQAGPKPLTPEQMVERLNLTYKWAETRVVPQVAQNFASKLVTSLARAMWPDKDIKDMTVSAEAATAVTQMLLTGVAMSISEVLPAIEKSIPAAVSQKWPHLDRIHNMGIREAALEHIGEMRDEKGNLTYPNLEPLIESGAMKRAMKTIPGFAKMHFSDDPVQDYVERIKLAYRVAQGSRPDPAALKRASQRGAERQREADNRARSGRLAPGQSKGTFGGQRKDAASAMLESFAQVDGDKFGAAVARDTKEK